MKRNINKIVAATLLATTFVACSDEIETSSYRITPYNANTSSIASAGTAVDLGLSVKWADKNVGAASAQDMGLSFIWGDVTGTQLSIADNTYAQGSGFDMMPYFNKFKNGNPEATEYETRQLASKNIKVVAVDSIRDNYACDIRIERHANVKVKDANGNFIPDGKGDYVREPKVYVEVDSVIVMAYKKEKYNEGLAAFLMTKGILKSVITELTGIGDLNSVYREYVDKDHDYADDQYNKYVIARSEPVFFNDVIQKLSPVDDFDVLAFIAETKKAKNKDIAWSTYSDPTFNEADGFLHADLIVEAYDTINYYKGRDENVPALTIVGNTNLDAAAKNWGADWAMPTSEQLQELIDKCDWEFEGNGYKVTSKVNGNSIFLPAAGYRYEDKVIADGVSGYYASGEVYGLYTFPSRENQIKGIYGSVTANTMANVLTFNAGQFDNSKRILNKFGDKNIGLSIRPVSKK